MSDEKLVTLVHDGIVAENPGSIVFDFAGRHVPLSRVLIGHTWNEEEVEVPFWLVKKEGLEGFADG
jgi:hypothetical protein